MPVRDYCHQDVVTAGPDDSARGAAILMKERNVGCVVLVDDKGRPVGVVTDRDLVQHVLRRRRDPDATPLSDVAGDQPIATVGADMALSRALARMRQEAVRRVVVVEPGGAVTGILTLDDILPIITKELGMVSDVVATQLAANPAPVSV